VEALGAAKREGNVMFVQVIQGHVSDVSGFHRQRERWNEKLRPGARGFLGSTSGTAADGTGFLLARFESESAARANSERPEQGAWWAETEPCFDGPVSFADTSDVELLMSGGSDRAGFVQVMRGSVADRALMVEMDALFEAAAPTWRPEVIGGLRAWVSPSDYVEVIYFTSEAAARASEQTPPPPELLARLADYENLMAGVEYLDLKEPCFHS
jgi:hypothetical protein